MISLDIVILIALLNLLILSFTFITKKFLYTKTPEKQWKPIVDEFDKNFKSVEDLDLSNYKLGSEHIY